MANREVKRKNRAGRILICLVCGRYGVYQNNQICENCKDLSTT